MKMYINFCLALRTVILQRKTDYWFETENYLSCHASVFISNLWWSLDNILRESGVIKLLVLVMVGNPEQGQLK